MSENKFLLINGFSTTEAKECTSPWEEWNECNCDAIPPTQTRTRECLCNECDDDLIETQSCEECEESTTMTLPVHETSMTTIELDTQSNTYPYEPITNEVFDQVRKLNPTVK